MKINRSHVSCERNTKRTFVRWLNIIGRSHIDIDENIISDGFVGDSNVIPKEITTRAQGTRK